MAEVKTNGAQGLDLLDLRKDILSSSTKRRIAKLRLVEQQLHDSSASAELPIPTPPLTAPQLSPPATPRASCSSCLTPIRST